MKKFVRALKTIIKMIVKTVKADKKDLKSIKEHDYNCSNECYLCNKEFKDEESNSFKHKVKDFVTILVTLKVQLIENVLMIL